MNDDSAAAPRKRPRPRSRKGSSPQPSDGTVNPQPRGRKDAARIDPVEFWGDPEALPRPDHPDEHAADARALLESLGRPPVSGQEAAAQRWITLVYERAAFLAGALAAAGEIDGSE